jgi:hypothetical protein
MPSSIGKPEQYFQAKFEIPLQDFAVRLVIAVLVSKKIVLLVDPKNLFFLNAEVRTNETTKITLNDTGVEGRMVRAATDDAGVTHES